METHTKKCTFIYKLINASGNISLFHITGRREKEGGWGGGRLEGSGS